MATEEINKQEEEINDITQQEGDNKEETKSLEETLREELNAEKDKYIRLFAEFENYKKRTAKERLELFSTASEGIINALLPVIDDFDRAVKQITPENNDSHKEGFVLINDKFKNILFSKGLSEVEISQGDAFNVDIAEAITQIPAGEDMKGKVVDIVEKGYKLGEKIIRFPKVVIGQ